MKPYIQQLIDDQDDIEDMITSFKSMMRREHLPRPVNAMVLEQVQTLRKLDRAQSELIRAALAEGDESSDV